ncbi:nitrate reductase molybdenum cofactor assembly chaperone [Brevibacterium litoralis]|uniref:nitrate reductase molybdenum cofactor assembly chaperone n=1 Tax=Brevibacterium litoralis TaxID=3138935 RepID=UPI0032ED53ED
MAFNPIAFFSKWKKQAAGLRAEDLTGGTLSTQVPLDDMQVRGVWTAASWLITYPDEGLDDALPAVRRLVSGLPGPVRTLFEVTLSAIDSRDRYDLRSEYVDTFDTRKKGCLYLTYFANGETRRRGMALLDFKETYRAGGLEVSEDELPDHLVTVLEFGAGHDLAAGVGLVLKNRAGLELLRMHLDDIDSPWAPVVQAVCLTLPALDGDDRTAIARLASEGPAEESVGLADGVLDMPPADLTPYAVDGSGCGVPGMDGGGTASGGPGGAGTAFVPLEEVGVLRR